MSKERRLGRGLEALLGRAPNPTKPQIHVPPEETPAQKTESKPVPLQVNQPSRGGVTPRRVEPTHTPYSGISLESPTAAAPEPTRPAEPSSGAPGVSPERAAEQGQDARGAQTPTPPEPESTRPVEPAAEPLPETDGTDTLLHVDIHLIETNPFQPRKHFAIDELKQLSESIDAHGLLQPLLVRRVDEAYQLIAGERRLRAAQAAGWREVPVKVVEADDRQMTELALVENLQRKDLNAMEKAASFKQHLKATGCTQEELARRLKIDRSTIANLIRLLELPEAVKQSVRENRITQGHARALLPLGDERRQIEFAQRIHREGLSVRATEQLVQETIDREDRDPLSVAGRVGSSSKARPQNAQIAALEQEFRAALGMKVKLTHNAKGRGKLVVSFGNHEEFERLRQHLLATERPAVQQRAG
ncbi:MAG: ParB/RepB/Spo0J family partition protein [Pirellulales bacterium]|nr:ParB/RepB/Spo0J family partition protein [Pirellulales bacterium]